MAKLKKWAGRAKKKDIDPNDKRTAPPKGSYTFLVEVSFQIQHTFTDAEVQRDSERGGPNNFEPTYEALLDLEMQLDAEVYSDTFGLSKFTVDKVETDSDSLLGIEKDESESQPKKRAPTRSRRKK